MKKILLIVDIQRGFLVNEMTAEAEKRINALAKSGVFDMIAASKYINLPENPIVRLMGWDKLMNEEEQCLIGEAGNAELIVNKHIFSAATPEFFHKLKEYCGGEYPDTVFLAGVDTECCVLSTAIDLFEEGIRPVVLSYYCASSGGELYHNAGILSLYHLIGKNNVYPDEIMSKQDFLKVRVLNENVQINSEEGDAAENETVRLLIKHGYHISFAESCTAGLCAGTLVNVPDASKIFDGSFVTYANEAKVKYLGVKSETIQKYGVVSEQVAKEMARGTALQNNAEVGVGISGIAGPGGGSLKKPVGMVCFGFYVNGKSFEFTKQFGNAGRNSVRRMSVEFVFKKLNEFL